MLSALYFIAIFPLEQIYKFLYIGFFRAFGDYGWALIGLSAIGAAIFYSLKKAAAALGKPLMGFRPSLEVLSQVPFLLAAYYMIEAFAPLRGQSCWLIADLRAPDALIGGLNLLPFLMTALNILAAFHVKKAARRERLQALVMAAVFLVVLYKGPSALLIYWIAVNLILWLGTRFANLLAAPLKNMAAGFSQRPVSLKIFKGLSRLNGLFDRLWDGRQRGVFAAATALIGALLFFYGPALIMTTSTFDVPTAEYELLSRSFYVLFVFWALGSFLLWSFCPPSMRSLLTLLYSLAALILSLNGLVFVGDYGLMEGPLFADTVDFGSLGRNIVRDLAVAGAAFLIIRLQGRKGFAFALFGIALVLTALSAVKMVGPIREHRVFLDNLPQEIEKEKEIFSYSPEGPNVIVMLLDGFDGEHVGKILDEYPDIKAQYKGFTWYPETLSPSRGTFYSVPSLWGGERLRFDKVYENGLEEAQAILASAYALVPDHFLSQGYKVLASWYGFDADLSGLSEKYGERFANKTTEAWEIADYQLLNNKKQAVVPHFLLGLSLFRSAPFVFKAPIYNQGRWLEGRRPFFAGAERENLQTVLSDAATNVGHEYRVVLERVLNQIELFKLLPLNSRLDSPRPTLKLMHLTGAHGYWFLPKDSLRPTLTPHPGLSYREGFKHMADDGKTLLLQYYTETHLLRLLGDFFDWLRREGIFDNSLIVLVSDHSSTDWVLTGRFPPDDKFKGVVIRPSALFMVKEIGAEPVFKESAALMMASDLRYFVCQAAGGCPGVERPDFSPDRERQYFVPFISTPPQESAANFIVYNIHGSHYDSDNWRVELRRGGQ